MYVYTSECICLRIQAMIHTDDESTLKRAVVLSNPPTVRVQLGECCNVYNKFINIYCSLCTKTESSSLVKCSIRFFFYLGYERYNLESALRPQNMEMYSLRQFHLSVTLCMYGQNLWNGRGQLTRTFEKTMDWNFSYRKCIFNQPKRI